jgi:hypothetical protein
LLGSGPTTITAAPLEEFLSGGNEVEALRKLQAGQSSSAIQGMYQVAHDTFRPSSTFWYLELASCYYPDPTDLWVDFGAMMRFYFDQIPLAVEGIRNSWHVYESQSGDLSHALRACFALVKGLNDLRDSVRRSGGRSPDTPRSINAARYAFKSNSDAFITSVWNLIGQG